MKEGWGNDRVRQMLRGEKGACSRRRKKWWRDGTVNKLTLDDRQGKGWRYTEGEKDKDERAWRRKNTGSGEKYSKTVLEQERKLLCVWPWPHKDVHNPTRMLMNRSDRGVVRGGGWSMMNYIRPPSLIFYLFFDRASEASMPSSIYYNPTFIMIDPPRNKSTGGSADTGTQRGVRLGLTGCYHAGLCLEIKFEKLYWFNVVGHN